MTELDQATIAGHRALLGVDGREFSVGAVKKWAVVEEGEAMPGERFTKSVEDADEVILHFEKKDLKDAGWELQHGLTLTGSDGRTYRVVKVFPDYSTPLQRLRCTVT